MSDKLNSLTVGPRGPILLQDHVLVEELAHFDRERIPERVVHAKGAGAFGYFEVRICVTFLWGLDECAGDSRHHQVLQGQDIQQGGEADAAGREVLHRGGRERLGRHCEVRHHCDVTVLRHNLSLLFQRPARIRCQVLHGGR